MDPDKTVEIANYLKERAEAGETIFYDIYSEEEKAEDPAKEDTGLFFFRGDPGARFAVCNAGGGFAYVGAMQDSFPHALELSKQGYNAFALILPDPARRRPVRIWRERSASSLSTRKSWKWIPTVIPSGAALPARGWRPGWGPMARKLLGVAVSRGRGRYYAVYRPFRLYTAGSSNLRLCGR